MLRFVFFLSAVFYLVVGGALYFLPATGVAGITFSPAWLPRLAGAVLVAWGLQLAVSSSRPSVGFVTGLVAGNLLVAATLVPAVLSGAPLFGDLPLLAPLVVAGLLAVLAVLAVVLPKERTRL
ncbi:hypothetical protein [Deinococcus yavapaiensis]|uniref:Uncharacterized protein n=1 Tax=Deinococcus yavapaiensis KR-236 TaxID=694435 RepID=A0A318SGP2_9DEIO|nr:hypothetical protein [Deinococcus yavapaiensis]PYE56275.1 hypothetical protein DES52_10179 [Deinococcus yavapaiensis KR-236]